MSAPPFVGLTGGIGAGKSEALAALERLGAATISADQVVHDLYDDPEVRAAVVARWGDEVAPDGRVDRAAVARRAFATEEDRGWLEGLLWPKVGERVARVAGGRVPRRARARWWSRRRCCSRRAWNPTTTRRSRSSPTRRCAPSAPRARGHEALDERTARQLTQAQKAERATYAVENSGSLRELEQELSEVLAKLTS